MNFTVQISTKSNIIKIKDKQFKEGYVDAEMVKDGYDRDIKFCIKSKRGIGIWCAFKDIKDAFKSDVSVKKEMIEFFNEYMAQINGVATEENFKEFFSGKGFDVYC